MNRKNFSSALDLGLTHQEILSPIKFQPPSARQSQAIPTPRKVLDFNECGSPEATNQVKQDLSCFLTQNISNPYSKPFKLKEKRHYPSQPVSPMKENA